jgi:uncharacterized membrane protein
LVTLAAVSAGGPARVGLIDAARGVAIAAMVVYHFSWDLRFFGYINVDVAADPAWRLFARSIAGSFLALVGVSLVLSARDGLNPPRFLRRLGVVAVAAAAITAVTWFMFPGEFIFFGILHAIAVSSVLGLAFLRVPIPVVIAAALFCFLAPALIAGAFFDEPALVWLGLSTYRPRSNDFVPLFPWFGVVLCGIAGARLAAQRWPATRGFPRLTVPRALSWAGRHSLAIYLVHQPLLFGLVYLAAQVAPPEPIGFAEWHQESCTRQCADAGTEGESCERVCACLTERSDAEGLAAPLLSNTLSESQLTRYFEIAGQCRGEPAR